MDLITPFILVVCCLVLSAFFSGSETALLRLGSYDAEEEAERPRGPSSLAVRDLLASTSKLLVTILLGNNLVNILAAVAASVIAVYYLGEATGMFVATVTMTLVVLVFCEVLPKAVAARHPRRIAYMVALPIYLLHQALRPVHYLFDRLVEPVVRRVGGGEAQDGVSTEMVLRLARSSRDGAPDGTPLAIMGATAGAAEMTVEEIMVPRTEIFAFDVSMEPAELLEQMLEERYTRIPIFQDSIDHILGVVHLKDLIQLVRKNGHDLKSILKPVLRVPERKKILRLLTEMQRAFVHLAVVKDEFGVTQGILTQEDILEEIVGEIRDEFDREELQSIRRMPDGSYVALGRVKVLDFDRATGLSIPSERGDSLAGLVFNTLGHAPYKGEVAEIPGFALVVEDVSGSRITRVRVRERAETRERA
jgi:CBS domain containing-hemolysin-like protein